MEKYEYIAKDKKMPKCITDHLEMYSDEENFEEKDSDKWNSEEENSSEEQMFFFFEWGILRVFFFEHAILIMYFVRNQFEMYF